MSNRGQFQKGHSGNPNGRPAVVDEVRDLARENTAEAIETLKQIMRDKKAPAQARVAASCAMLDRGYGKPAQSVDLNHKSQDVADMLEEINGRTRGIPNGARSVQ